MPDDPVRLLSSRDLYRSERMRFCVERHATPDGEVERPALHHPGGVGLIVRPRPGRLLLVRQWRYPLGRETLEIPAGTRAPGEAPEVTAARELEEEAGMRAGRLVEVLRTHLAPGISDELMVFYRAEDLTPVPPHPDHGELLRAEEVGEADLPRLLADGLVCDAKTLVALALEGLWP